MINRRIFIFVILMIVLSGCIPSFESEEEKIEEIKEEEDQLIILPNIKTAEEYYQTVLPYEHSEARGLILYGLNSRLDIDELEIGLMRLAQDTFSPEKYFFQEGQLLSGNVVNNWLKRKDAHELGLNPAVNILPEDTWQEKINKNKEKPSYLSYILEHNYLVKKEEGVVELGGVVLGVSLNSIFYIDVYDDARLKHFDHVVLNDEEIEKQGKIIAGKIAQRVRSMPNMVDVPIIIGLFKEAPKSSVIPGSFIAMTVVEPGKSSIASWKAINEKYVLFPSSDAAKTDTTMSNQFEQFKEKIDEFFPNYVGIIGKGFYKDDNLQRLVIDIPIQFYGKTEIISFTQFVTALMMNGTFPNDILIEVNISSLQGAESLIVVKPGEKDPLVHIYR
ncbi:CamS family sex pheromone protein [Lottiidibacillus patelloidae]|nr:CamS family sex pheromone protein [Lottiidibacillus patelloidae]